MNRLKDVMWWMQVAMVCIAFGFGWVGVLATDEWLLYDAVAREKVALLTMLASAFGVCTALWALTAFFVRVFRAMNENDPDFGYDFERCQMDEFPDSPKKPR